MVIGSNERLQTLKILIHGAPQGIPFARKEAKNTVLHAITLTLILFGTWLILSGYYTMLLIALGILSVAISITIALRMDLIDRESHPIHLFLRIPGYWLWLLVQIIKSNIDVSKTILGLGNSPSQSVLKVQAPQSEEISQVIYANSITLTPGTVTIELDNGEITVHALTRASAADLQNGEMGRKIKKLEAGG